jgi:hypothetical protein
MVDNLSLSDYKRINYRLNGLLISMLSKIEKPRLSQLLDYAQ